MNVLKRMKGDNFERQNEVLEHRSSQRIRVYIYTKSGIKIYNSYLTHVVHADNVRHSHCYSLFPSLLFCDIINSAIN